MNVAAFSILFITVGSVFIGFHFHSGVLGLGIGFIAYGLMPEFHK